MRFQKTHEQDIPQLTGLWKQAFGDPDEEIARFFRGAFPHCTGFAARDGEKIAAMCFALPQSIVCGEESRSAAYLYAVATDEACRGRGLCRSLLTFAEKELKKRGCDCVLLVPASGTLAEMYEKLGYSGPLRTAQTLPAPAAAGQGAAVSVPDYAGLRETLLWDVPHVRYSRTWLEYEHGDTDFYALRLGAMPGCAAARKNADGSVQVDELLPDGRFLPALHAALNGTSYTLPQKPYAMCKWLTAQPAGWAQIHLAFDFG